MIQIKSAREIEVMRKAGEATAFILRELARSVRPGITTNHLDELAMRLCREEKVKPAFLGYQGYPKCLCASVNDQVVHGIPSERVLLEGDIIGLDFGVILDGYYGDSAVTVGVGKVSSQAQALMDAAQGALETGIRQVIEGNRLFDISNAIQTYTEQRGYSVVREFVGHGIGRNLHEEPQIPNFGPKGKGVALKPGMVFAIEPMINIGKHAVRIEKDGWTASTSDGSLSAHFEHTVLITEHEPEILTIPRSLG